MSGRHAQTNGWRVAGRILVATLATLVVLASGAGFFYLSSADQQLQSHAISALVPDDPSIRSDLAGSGSGGSTATTGSTGPGVAENILILGLDTRAKQAAAGKGTSQSDVIMIAHVPADRSRVDLVSIPRDLMITAPTCKAWDYSTNTLSDHDFDNPYSQWKITNAYAVGGPQCTVKAVQALTGLRMDRLIVFNFEGFKSIVDALGGVTMTFDGPVVNDGKTVIEHAGTQLINGDTALKLVRSRKVAGDPTGDIGRIGRQQSLLAAILAETTHSDLLSDPARLNATLQTVLAHSNTDNVTIDDLVDLATSLQGVGAKGVHSYTVPTVYDTEGDGLLAGDGIQAYFDALAADQPVADVAS